MTDRADPDTVVGERAESIRHGPRPWRNMAFGTIFTATQQREKPMIKGLHHNAYRCRDSEETRRFYEDFLGLELVSAFPIDDGRALHTFFRMDDGSCLAFFEAPKRPFDFKRQDSLDLHIALGVEPDTFDAMLDKAKAQGREVRGPVDHGFVRSIYFRDPNGYVIELTASTGVQQEIMDPAVSKPHAALARWQHEKPGVARAAS
jgi:catechol 2,3-dioxygenase-like lactoylglutathione lyase family enzyme